MSASRLHAWNYVDVMGSSGLLHRGFVRDTTDSGLLIDFLIDNKPPELYPYDKILRFSDAQLAKEPLEMQSAYFLVQVSADQPWTWYPATALAGAWSTFVLVDFVHDNVHIRDFFRQNRIRPSGSWQNVTMTGYCCKQSSVMSVDFIPDQPFLDLWQQKYKGYPAESKQQNMPTSLSANFADTKTLTEGSTRRELERTTAGEADSYDRWLAVLSEILSCLRNGSIAPLRRVCRAWESAHYAASRTIIIQLPSNWERPSYRLGFYVKLFKLLTKSTKYIVLVGPRRVPCRLDNISVGFAKQMVKIAGATPTTAMLVDVYLDETVFTNGRDMDLVEWFQPVCSRLLMKKVTVELPVELFFAPMKCQSTCITGFTIPYCVVNVRSQPKLIHTVFDANISDFVGVKTLRIVAALFGRADGNVTIRTAFLEVIKKFECENARLGEHCTWPDMQRAKLHIMDNLLKLRRTTLYVLLQVTNAFLRGLEPSSG